MTLLTINKPVMEAIPIFALGCGHKKLRLVHPDILFEMPITFNPMNFTLDLIDQIKLKYQESYLSPNLSTYKINIFEDTDSTPAVITYQNYIYLDMKKREGLLALDISNASDILIDNIVMVIKEITMLPCYQNKLGKNHPSFNSLHQRRIMILKKETFNEEILKKYEK